MDSLLNIFSYLIYWLLIDCLIKFTLKPYEFGSNILISLYKNDSSENWGVGSQSQNLSKHLAALKTELSNWDRYFMIYKD
jgi:hypothetical protein